MTAFKNSLFYCLLYLLPKNLVSRFMGYLVSLTPPRSMAIFINRSFARSAGITVEDAEFPLEAYTNLQSFFARKLKPNLRPIAQDASAIISPCDGFLSIAGAIKNGRLASIKGKYYSVASLLDSEELAARFEGGYFATIYLSPRDYHRFHAPVSGQITETIYIPGALWPVNRWAVKQIPDLFCQNERIISLIKPDGGTGMLASIAVGATMVGKIKLNYCDLESNVTNKKMTQSHLQQHIGKGDELGTFMFGSTIVLLFEPGMIKSVTKEPPVAVFMGEELWRRS